MIDLLGADCDHNGGKLLIHIDRRESVKGDSYMSDSKKVPQVIQRLIDTAKELTG